MKSITRFVAASAVLSLMGIPGHASGVPGTISRIAGGGAGDGLPALTVALNVGSIWPSPSRGLLFGHLWRVRQVSEDGVISTIAGTHVHGYDGFAAEQIGVDRPAITAKLGYAIGATTEDGAGNVYFSTLNYIFRIDASSGTLRHVAGTGSYAFTGDGGPARSASLYQPGAMLFDHEGNLLVADTGNKRVRKITPSGLISTVAGNGQDGADGDGGPATNAALGPVFGLAVDRTGNVYVSGSGYTNRIRKIDPSGRISTVAGNGTPGFSGDGGGAVSAQLHDPIGLWVDNDGGLLIADSANSRIRRVDLSTGIIGTIAGTGQPVATGDGGPAHFAGLGHVNWVVQDQAGHLFVSHSDGNSYIRRINPDGVITRYAGTERACCFADGVSALNAALGVVKDVATDRSGNLFIAAGFNVWRVDGLSGIVTRFAGNDWIDYSGDGGPARNAGLAYPGSVAVDKQGNVYIASGDNRVRMVDADTGIIKTIAGTGAPTIMCTPNGPRGDGLPAILVNLACVADIALDRIGKNLYFSEIGRGRVATVSLETGILTTVAGGTQSLVQGDGLPATLAELHFPRGIDLDPAGNLYIAESGRDRVRRVDAITGIISTIAGTGEWGEPITGQRASSARLAIPLDVEVSNSGVVYVSSFVSRKVWSIDDAGIIHHVAGCNCGDVVGSSGGDGGPATEANFDGVPSLALDANGNLFVGEFDGGIVRRIEKPM